MVSHINPKLRKIATPYIHISYLIAYPNVETHVMKITSHLHEYFHYHHFHGTPATKPHIHIPHHRNNASTTNAPATATANLAFASGLPVAAAISVPPGKTGSCLYSTH
jgi:hypothetical protein